MIPSRIKDIGLFIIYFFILNILLFIQIQAKRNLNSNKYISFITFIRVTLSGLLILYMRGFIAVSFNKIMNPYVIISLLMLSVYIMDKNFKYISYESKVRESIYFIEFSNKILKISNNKDLVMAIRKNLFIDPILLILISNIFLKSVSSTKEDMYYSCILSIVCSFIVVFIELVNDERGKITLFYNKLNYKNFKIDKMKSTIYIQLITLVLLAIPLMFCIPIKILFISYVVSIIVVIVSIYLVNISLERDGDFKNIIKDRDIVMLYIVGSVLSIIFISVICKL